MEKPILFNTPMINAILAGNKTMTRRVVTNLDLIQDVEDGVPYFSDEYGDYHKTVSRCPYGQPGGMIWVRETWAASRLFDLMAPRDIPNGADLFYFNESPDNPKVTRWRPSIHMPKKFCRIWLKVKSVRVEYLNAITRDDIIKEGVCQKTDKNFMIPWITLWDTINSDRGYSWESNPWVWVVEFEISEKPTFMKSMGAALQGKPVDNEFMKANLE